MIKTPSLKPNSESSLFVTTNTNEAFKLTSLKKIRPALSLFIAFYNKLHELKLILTSLETQSLPLTSFEVIICDDGSKPEIVQELQQLLNNLPFPVQHIWHEDVGFRKNRILNQGIRQAKSDYFVFIDGDCVLHPDFLKDHYEARSDKTILAGRRADLTPFVSELLTPQKIKNGFLQKEYWWIFFMILWMKDNNAPKGIPIRNSFIKKIVNNLKPRGIVGCNFSVNKKDILEINGFDMRYEAPGTGEDSDIEFRMLLNGSRVKPLLHSAIQYHVYHKLLLRPSKNEEIFKQVIFEKKIITDFGINQLADENKGTIS